jgi:hypothetical protein
MNKEPIKPTPSHGVFRFSNFANAKDFVDRATKSVVIVLGDDGRHWVVSLGFGEELVKSGFELAE